MDNEKSNALNVMPLSDAEMAQRLQYVNLTAEDCKLLKSFQSVIIKQADKIVDEFYNNIVMYPELNAVIQSAGSNVNRLKVKQKEYLINLFCGDYNRIYFENNLKIGALHKKIGLTPKWYLGGYSVYLQLINPLILKKYWYSSRRMLKLLSAVNKIISIDSQLAIDNYVYALVEDIQDVSTSKSEIESKVAMYKVYVDNISEGDLSKTLEITGDDDLASLGRQLNIMSVRLAAMISNVKNVGGSLLETTDKLSNAVITHSTGATQQASAVSETTSTLEEIRVTSEQTQSKALALGAAAENIRIEGENGIEAVFQLIESMDDIRERVNSISHTILSLSEKTQQIGSVNNVIANLTQQSKMLALNASIEAAKAGEAGKGFAVVATEVRDLAEQSQESTEQVHIILRDIQLATDRVVMATEQGTKGVDQVEVLVNSTSDIMQKLNNVIQESVISSQQIVAAVRQEGAGISQVAVAMNQINSVTTQFVMAAEQTKTVSYTLMQISDKLNETLNVYK